MTLTRMFGLGGFYDWYSFTGRLGWISESGLGWVLHTKTMAFVGLLEGRSLCSYDGHVLENEANICVPYS